MRNVRVVEVGPRDGLQNEATPLSLDVKLRFIQKLAEAGLREIEATSFVSPKWVPQLADAGELWPLLSPGPLYSAFIPNLKGLERAQALGVNRIALFTAASETFARQNVNMSIAETLEQIRGMVATARGSWVRVYVSTVFECPYEGRTPIEQVVRLCAELSEMEIDEISLGDTIGVAGPDEVRQLGERLLGEFGADRFAWHFHDTWGTGLANVSEALRLGFMSFDASAGGLGGCPYAPGAGGNLSTEDLIYLLERSDRSPGVNLELLAQASEPILSELGRGPASKAQVATLARCAAWSGPT